MSSKLLAMSGAAALVAILSGAGLASAEDITGTPENDVLLGTPQRDTIHGLAGDDEITPGKGNDRAFGEEGGDIFHWANGDGRDRLVGGSHCGGFCEDRLIIAATSKLRLHIDALEAGPLVTAQTGLEAIAVRGIERISINISGIVDLILSSDAGILPPDRSGHAECYGNSVIISCHEADDLLIFGGVLQNVDARKVQASTRIAGIGPGGKIRGSAKFFDVIGFGYGEEDGDQEVWTGDGGSYVDICSGSNNVVHLGRGIDVVNTEDTDCHNTVFGFSEQDLLSFQSDAGLIEIDTNNDGLVDAKDSSVKVRNGSMTLTFPYAGFGTQSSITLVGVTRVRFDHFRSRCYCSE